MNTETQHTKTEKQFVPQLRFAEFEGEWERFILGEIATFRKGKNISKVDIVEDGETECIRYGELYTEYDEVITNIKSKTNLLVKDLIFSEENDVIIPASGETQIDIATASCVTKGGIALGGDLNIIKTEKDGIFLSYYLNSEKKFDIARLAQGNSVVHIYNSQLKTLKLNFPTLPEQQKIASFLTAVDTKLQQLTSKKELLQQYKKGVMQQLFPSTGSGQVPQLRFKQPDGSDYPDWRKSKIGESCKVSMCKRIFADQTSENGDVPFYKIGTVGEKPDAFIKRELFEEYKNKYKFPRKGEILITCSGTVGKCIPYDGKEAYYQDSNIVWLDNPSLEISNEYLYYVLSEFNWGKLNSTTIARIYGSDLRNLRIEHPVSKEEQQHIASYLSALDTKIETLTQQIENTQQFKKGLLQQMFV